MTRLVTVISSQPYPEHDLVRLYDLEEQLLASSICYLYTKLSPAEIQQAKQLAAVIASANDQIDRCVSSSGYLSSSGEAFVTARRRQGPQPLEQSEVLCTLTTRTCSLQRRTAAIAYVASHYGLARSDREGGYSRVLARMPLWLHQLLASYRTEPGWHPVKGVVETGDGCLVVSDSAHWAGPAELVTSLWEPDPAYPLFDPIALVRAAELLDNA